LRTRKERVAATQRAVLAALVVHPSVPADAREAFVKQVRRRHIKIEDIRRVTEYGRVGVAYRKPERSIRTRRHMRHYRRFTPKKLRDRAAMYERRAIRYRKRAATLERKQLEAKKRKARKLAKKRSR
jgi:hypothetical protein